MELQLKAGSGDAQSLAGGQCVGRWQTGKRRAPPEVAEAKTRRVEERRLQLRKRRAEERAELERERQRSRRKVEQQAAARVDRAMDRARRAMVRERRPGRGCTAGSSRTRAGPPVTETGRTTPRGAVRPGALPAGATAHPPPDREERGHRGRRTRGVWRTRRPSGDRERRQQRERARDSKRRERSEHEREMLGGREQVEIRDRDGRLRFRQRSEWREIPTGQNRERPRR